MRLPPEGTLLGGPEAVSHDRPEYPYGLSIHLDESSIKALGLSSLPKVGDALKLEAKVTVKSVSVSEREGKSPERSVTLQITDMDLDGASEGKSQANIIYMEDN
jgi:hypothetical protein